MANGFGRRSFKMKQMKNLSKLFERKQEGGIKIP